MILNVILSGHLMQNSPIDVVSPTLIRETVRSIEEKISAQIITAHSFIWPDAYDQILMVLKLLRTNVVTYGDLQRAFNKAGVSGFGNVYRFSDFLRMLTELGVIGRLIQKTDKYNKAVFEYSEPFRLIFNDDEELCIHPCFTECFGVVVEGRIPKGYRPVYPLGSDPVDADRRDEA
jgi:hypothetical protein